MKSATIVLLLVALRLRAQDTGIFEVDGDRLAGKNGGGASVAAIHPRTNGTFSAGATFHAIGDTRWVFASAGATHQISPRTLVTASADLGRGRDDRGRFPHVLLRAGVMYTFVPEHVYGEAEWLRIDAGRQRSGIARASATVVARRLTIRPTVYRSLRGDSRTSLAMLRTDYDLGLMTAIAGVARGTATPVLVQQPVEGGSSRIREWFAGVTINSWTVLFTSLTQRQQVTLIRRVRL